MRATPSAQSTDTTGQSELRQALALCRSSFVTAGVFSLFVNLLMLVPSFYMLQIYDRVLATSSESTLTMLTLIAVFLFLVLGALDWVRAQILLATSARLDQALGSRVYEALFTRAVVTGGRISSAQPLGDLAQLRQFLTGPGLFAFFDAPWVPIYIGVMFMFHPLYGVVAIISALALLGLTVWGEVSTRGDLDRATRMSGDAWQLTQQHLRSAEAIEVMGMMGRLRSRWHARQRESLDLQARASHRGGLIANLSKVFRMTIQSLILGVGAWLAIHKQISPGILIAGAILLGRALAPLDLMIASWRGFQSARGAYGRLDALFKAAPAQAESMPLPPPSGALSLNAVSIRPPGASAMVLRNVSLELHAGATLAVIGPSGAGKSTLLRAMLGLYLPQSGSVRLDGAELSQWSREQLGPHIGYLPQDVELLDGTVAENISRFGQLDSERVIAAAKAAGVHELIVHLADGYETMVAGNGQSLSAGQRQRIGLARALYGDPRLIVLDEPNANLDQEGEAALARTLGELKALGRTVVVVTHRSGLLEQMDLLALLVDGELTRFGPRDKVLAALQHPVARVATPVTLPLRAAPGGG